ncbi:MAG: hypothetical protein K8U57_29095 [Planctomycetes bacterium]|nr:hypothetical protein [Planctomycetota bacterium]
MVSRMVALACPVLLFLTTPAMAAHGGGGHGGGGHGGGGHGGHSGGYHSGGYHGSYHHGGYHHTGYYGGYGNIGYGGYGYGLGYGNYGYGLGYGNSGYNNYGYNNYSTPYYSSGGYYYPSQVLGTQVIPAGGFTPASATVAAPAQLTVVVAAGAQVWFNGQEDTANTPARTFSSAVLQPGQRSTVTVRVMQNGSSQEMTLPIVAGDRMSVDLSR